MISSYEMSFPYLKRSLSILNPWLIQLDLDAINRIDSRNDHRINPILEIIYSIEQKMAAMIIK
jgi:tRNA A37 N6-isopentenylltransferase MiaA